MDAQVGLLEPTRLHAVRRAIALILESTDAYSKRKLAQSFFFLVIFSVLSAVTPVIYKLLIDGLTSPSSTAWWSTPAALLVAFILLQLVARIAGTLRALVHGQGLQRLSRTIGVRLFSHVLSLPLRYHLERKAGGIGDILDQGLSGCHTLLQHLVFTFLPVMVEFLAIALVLVHYGHWKYLALFTAASIAYALVFGRAAREVTAPSEAIASASIEANGNLVDTLLNCETVKYFAGETAMTNKFDNAMALLESRWCTLLRIQTRNGIFIAIIFTLSLSAALGLAGYDTLSGVMTVGDFVLINTYVIRLVQPLETIGYAVRDMAQALGFLQKMLQLLDEVAESDHGGRALPSVGVKGTLTFENVSLSYGAGRFGLKHVSFCVPAGRTIAVVGPSGCGKSSLVRLIFRLYEPQSGRILIDGNPISELALSSLREAIAVVPQDTVLFNDSIRANLAFANPSASFAEIKRAAALARLDKFIEGLPDGYDTIVGERGLKLSGGERQRTAIARAALKKPRVFVFDEATSSLDSTTEREVIDAFATVVQHCTTLVIAHRLSTIVHADEILLMEQGRIASRGTHSELLATSGTYAAMWRAQSAKRNRVDAEEVR